MGITSFLVRTRRWLDLWRIADLFLQKGAQICQARKALSRSGAGALQ
jgi:hypothetical protein